MLGLCRRNGERTLCRTDLSFTRSSNRSCNQTDKLPRYPYLKGDPIGYGHGIFERLLQAGLNPAEVIEIGSPIIAQMVQQIAGGTKSEVTEKEDFS